MKKRKRFHLSRILFLTICILLSLLPAACAGSFSNAEHPVKTGSGMSAGTYADAGSGAADSTGGFMEEASAGRTDGLREELFTDDLTIEGLQPQIDALSAAYGVNILCGEDVPLSFADYTVKQMSEAEPVREALQVIDDTLALYPPAFFPSVCQDFCDSITICLARDLQAVDGDVHMEYVNAFTTVQDDTIWLVINAQEDVQSSTLVHEITHVIDYRLLGMQQLHEREWNQLNPPDFSYYNAYMDDAGNDYRLCGSPEYTSQMEEDPARIYFYDPYSRTYAMEDRARLMEKLFECDREDTPDLCFSSPHIQTKLRFYFYTLRRAFENGRWPEETAWESAFRRSIQRR